jgi:replicative DNA helicase
MDDTLLNVRIENENLLLACALYDPVGVRQQVGWVSPDMFHQQAQGRIWRKFMAGATALDAALDERLNADLMKWAASLPSAAYVEAHAKQVARGHYMAQSRAVATEHITATYRADYDTARASAVKFTQLQPASRTTVRTMADAAGSLIAAIEQGGIAIKTGIAPIDASIGGMERRNEFVLAARPSTGKTALALQIARNVALSGGNVLYISYEMPEESLLARMACPLVGVSWTDVRAGNLPRSKVQELLNAASTLGMELAPHFYVEDGTPTIEAVWEMAVTVEADLLVIDHLGLVPKVDDNEVESLGLITKACKDLAKQRDLAALVLVQMSRDVERRVNAVPRMSDLRGSGKIEENADIVAFLHSQEAAVDNSAPTHSSLTPPAIRKVDLLIAKDRNGVRDSYKPLDFHLQKQWFTGRGELIPRSNDESF